MLLKKWFVRKNWIPLAHTLYVLPHQMNQMVTTDHSHTLFFLADLLVDVFLAEVLEEEEKRLSSFSPNNPEEVDDGFLATEGDLLLSTLSVRAPNTDTPPTGF